MAEFSIDILANISKSVSAIQSLGKEVNKEVSKINSAFDSVKTYAVSALAAIGVGFSLKAAINEAVEAEEALNSFNIVLRQTGIFTQEGSDSFQEFALTLQRSTGIADNAILDLASSIQRFAGVSQQDLAKATAATIDFAKFAGIDLTTAAQAVGKAIQGSEGALARYGIQVKAGRTESEQFANVLNALGIAQGTAEQRAKSFSGQISILKEEFNTLLETLGTAIITNPKVLDAINFLRGAVISFSKSLQNPDSLVIKLIESLLSLTKVVYVLGDVGFRALTIAADSLLVAFSGFVSVGARLISAFLKIVRATGLFRDVIDSATTSLDRFADIYTSVFKVSKNSIKNELTRPFTDFNKELETANTSVDKLTEKLSSKKGISFELKDKGKAASAEQAEQKKVDAKQAEESKKLLDEQKKVQDDFRNKITQVANSLVNSVSQGAAGVAGAFAQVTALAVDQLIPGFGGVAGQLLSFLAQGPEAVKAQITAFVENIPVVIQAIVDAIPAAIETIIIKFTEDAPRIAGSIITNLSAQMPVVATRLAFSLIEKTPEIARNFIQGLISEAGRLIQAIADGVKDAIKGVTNIGGGITKGVGGALGGIKKVFGFSEGGVVGGGAPFVDRVPAALTPGESVLTRDTTKKLDEFLSNGGGQQNQNVTINLQIGEAQLASVLLSLNRRGFRTA